MSSYFERRLMQVKKPWVIDRYFGNLSSEPVDSMSILRLESFHKDALKEIVANAYKKCAFYSKKMDEIGVKPTDIRTLADIKKLPFTNKEELRGNPWALLACDKKDISVITVSTGTTGGEEIYIPTSYRDYALSDITPRYPKLFPIDPGDVCFNALPYEMSSAGLSFHKVFMDGCTATVVNAGKGGAYSTPQKGIKVLKDLQPNIIITTPSWAIHLAEAAEEAGFDIKSLNLKKMWLTGEGCSNSFRDRVEKIYGTVINTYYGSLECGGIGIECDQHDGYHIMSAQAIVEIVDPATGEPLEPGEIGEIVVTCPLRYDTPIIRYKTKDLGYISPDICECGVTIPKLFLRGRLVDQLTVNGVSFSPYYFEEFLMRLPEVGNWYQFVIKEGDNEKLKVRAEVAKGCVPSEDLADKLASKMEFSIGVPCEFDLVEKMPRTLQKAKRVVIEEDAK